MKTAPDLAERPGFARYRTISQLLAGWMVVSGVGGFLVFLVGALMPSPSGSFLESYLGSTPRLVLALIYSFCVLQICAGVALFNRSRATLPLVVAAIALSLALTAREALSGRLSLLLESPSALLVTSLLQAMALGLVWHLHRHALLNR